MDSFAYSVMTSKCVTSKDSWAFDMIGKIFHYKELEREDDIEYRNNNISNTSIIHSLVLYDGKSKKFLKSSVRYATRCLHFLFYSVDNVDEYELAPAASFHPKMKEGSRFYCFNVDAIIDQLPITKMQGPQVDASYGLNPTPQSPIGSKRVGVKGEILHPTVF